MSIFHETLTKIYQLLDSKSQIEIKKSHSIINEHISHVKSAFKENSDLNFLLEEYYETLENAKKDIKNGEIEKAKSQIQTAHEMVLRLQEMTRKLLGEEHEFLD